MHFENIISRISMLIKIGRDTEAYILGCEALTNIALKNNQLEVLERLGINLEKLKAIKQRQKANSGRLEPADIQHKYDSYSQLIKLSQVIVPRKSIEPFRRSFSPA
ncbi:hypothetical protein VCHA53O466_140131 [Vibrio chagasii]|nr:hypothetical protein VCHA53O466_140131 [Vibrio chagasii]